MWNRVVQVSQHNDALLFQVTGCLHLPHNCIDELTLDGFDSTLLDNIGYYNYTQIVYNIIKGSNKYIYDSDITTDIHWRLATNIEIKKIRVQLGFNLIVCFMVTA